MNKHFTADNADDLYQKLISAVAYAPEYIVRPRKMEVKEITNVTAVLTNPRHCLVTLKDRKLNYAFSTIEKLQYLTGECDPDRLVFYNSNIAHFQNKYGFYDGDYSVRIHYWLEYIYKVLKADPDTRQAVMTIYGPQDRHESLDIPCTVMHQYMIRDGKLNLTVVMRSNDLLWGFPLDINAFCFLQEFLAACLNVEIGTYTHIVGSMHLYTEREEQLTKLLGPVVEYNEVVNPTIEKGIDFHSYLHDALTVLSLEREYRMHEHVIPASPLVEFPSLSRYQEQLEKYIDGKRSKA